MEQPSILPPESVRLEGVENLDPQTWEIVRSIMQAEGVRVVENEETERDTLISYEQAVEIGTSHGFSRGIVTRGWKILLNAAEYHSADEEAKLRKPWLRVGGRFEGLNGVEFISENDDSEPLLDVASLAGKLREMYNADNAGDQTYLCWRTIFLSTVNPPRSDSKQR